MKTYLRHKITNVIDVKGLVALEYLDFEGKYKEYTEKHDFYELCYVERGAVSLLLEDREIQLSSGSVILISPNAKHTYSSREGNISRAFVTCFECQSHMLKFISDNEMRVQEGGRYCIEQIISEGSGTFHTDTDGQLQVIRSANFGGQQAIILQLEFLLIGLLRQKLSERKSGLVLLSGESYYTDLVEVIVNYLRSNISRRLTLADICSHFNYSRSFLCRIFKEQKGIPLFAYFTEMKVEEACRLLGDTDYKIVEISEALGFSEPKYFGSVFRAQMGISPTEYREKMRNGG